MKNKIFFEIHKNLPREGPGRNKYTRKAYLMLPSLNKPEILDIGCGTGEQTIELAKVSGGNVIGIDNHQPYLCGLEKKIMGLDLSDRVKVLNLSMFDLDFGSESFDVIWAEGSIYIIGFEKGLLDWKRFIKKGGFLVVHDVCWLKENPPAEIKDYWEKMYPGIKNIPANLEIIKKCNYELIGYFTLPEDAWWLEYYLPLEKRLEMLSEKYKNNSDALKVIDEEKKDIEMYRKYPDCYGSVFYVMRK